MYFLPPSLQALVLQVQPLVWVFCPGWGWPSAPEDKYSSLFEVSVHILEILDENQVTTYTVNCCPQRGALGPSQQKLPDWKTAFILEYAIAIAK